MSDQVRQACAFDGCCQPSRHDLRFELVEPADPEAVIGVFTLSVCDQHFRPEFVAQIATSESMKQP